MIHWRRLVRDYEKRIDVSQAIILVTIGRQYATLERRPMIFQTDSKSLIQISV
jgi:hypothetical protein